MSPNFRSRFLAVAALLIFPAGLLFAQDKAGQKADQVKVDVKTDAKTDVKTDVKTDSWDGNRALATVVDLVKFTPRAMETPGHQKAIDYIVSELKKTKFDAVTQQRWIAREAGRTMAMTNIIARFNPANPRRVIVATHYDSIIKAYRDAKTPDAPMPGANNSGSGVAVLLETARVLSELPEAPPVGIDMIFFDGEEGPLSLGAGDPNFHSIGSPYFTERLAEFYPNAKPEKMLDFDMVCDRDLHLKAEQSGLRSAPLEVKKFWDIGMEVAPHAFERQPAPYAIQDDHTAFHLAGIPSFVVIDFEYEPFYNTTEDTPDKCSAQSLEAVGRTLVKYLYLP
ncbi:putative aminopeptidase [Bradyrhizobium sp. YR681]|uniref:M28 family peptidase n=1 Tax=Bradyrhizobium sp. YR681 TaxID=1144344 RepID=UPI000270F56C|nr:M28 family peptidase [Bradyrhizobium sp. YR681]EJN16316.1 putative aminopeptidase [Bradyrhizobium sp. YR681]